MARESGKAERQGALLLLVGRVRQMHFKDRRRGIGGIGISGQERCPGAQRDRHRSLGLVFQVRHRIVPPVIDAPRLPNTFQSQVGTRCRDRVAPVVIEFRLASGEHPRRPAHADPQERAVQRPAARRQVIENGAVAESAGGFQIQASRVQGTQGHAADGANRARIAVDDARNRLAKTGGRELSPLGGGQSGGKETILSGQSVCCLHAWAGGQRQRQTQYHFTPAKAG